MKSRRPELREQLRRDRGTRGNRPLACLAPPKPATQGGDDIPGLSRGLALLYPISLTWSAGTYISYLYFHRRVEDSLLATLATSSSLHSLSTFNVAKGQASTSAIWQQVGSAAARVDPWANFYVLDCPAARETPPVTQGPPCCDWAGWLAVFYCEQFTSRLFVQALNPGRAGNDSPCS